jgi:DNA-binding SARP family transcriptional activator/predicted ATPase
MPNLRFTFFGAPQLLRDGLPIEVDTRKAIALLAYLAVSGQPQRRDTMAALLWPEYSQSKARAGLRRTLSSLNKALGGEGLIIEREEISLDRTAGAEIDVQQFRSLLEQVRSHDHLPGPPCRDCTRLLRRAVDLAQADFMAGFTLRDSAEFDDWQYLTTESYRRELVFALGKLVAALAASREFEPAIHYANRQLNLDRLNEEAHRQLMRLYAWSGQRNQALQQYQRCQQVMDEELGVEPLEETASLHEDILKNRLQPPPEQLAAAPEIYPSPDAEPHPFQAVLVGRAAEWERLNQAYSGVARSGQFLGLTGEAGIGKSRLAHEFLNLVRERAGRAVWVRCYEGETGLAYGPLSHLVRASLSLPGSQERLESLPRHWLLEAGRLLPELAPPGQLPDPVEGPGAQSRLFESLRQLMGALLSGPQPGCIFLDDLHWSDAASLDWLAYLVRRLEGTPLLVLCAWRSDHPSAASVSQLSAAAARESRGEVLQLDRLALAEVVELLANADLPELVDSAGLAARLQAEAEGLPYFIVEYLQDLPTLLAAGASAEWPVPESVRSLVRARLETIDETARQLLASAAVIGRTFDFELLSQASGRSPEETVSGLENLINRGLIAEQEECGEPCPAYDFNHEKLRDLVYEQISQARRRLLHRRVAEALSARMRGLRGGQLAGVIANHYLQAGLNLLAAEYARLAGDYARSVFANREALEQYRIALNLGNPETGSLLEAIGDLLTLGGEYNRAIDSYTKSAHLSSKLDQPRLELKLGEVSHRLGDWVQAESHFIAGLECLDQADAQVDKQTDTADNSRLYAAWSLTAHQRGQTERAWELAEQALNLAGQDTSALIQANNILGVLARHRGQHEKARRYLETSQELADQAGDRLASLAALNNLALVYSDQEDLEQAIALEQAALLIAQTLGDLHRQAALLNNLADLYYQTGQTEQAMQHLKLAVAIFAQISDIIANPQPEIWKLTEW